MASRVFLFLQVKTLGGSSFMLVKHQVGQIKSNQRHSPNVNTSPPELQVRLGFLPFGSASSLLGSIPWHQNLLETNMGINFLLRRVRWQNAISITLTNANYCLRSYSVLCMTPSVLYASIDFTYTIMLSQEPYMHCTNRKTDAANKWTERIAILFQWHKTKSLRIRTHFCLSAMKWICQASHYCSVFTWCICEKGTKKPIALWLTTHKFVLLRYMSWNSQTNIIYISSEASAIDHEPAVGYPALQNNSVICSCSSFQHCSQEKGSRRLLMMLCFRSVNCDRLIVCWNIYSFPPGDVIPITTLDIANRLPFKITFWPQVFLLLFSVI